MPTFTFQDITFSITVQAGALFRAAEIAALLNISNIKTTLSEFDDEERATHWGEEFLTIHGIYRLIQTYRSPLGLAFRKWATSTIGDILVQSEREARQTAEDMLKIRVAQQHCPGMIYVIENLGDAERNLYKVGRTQDLGKRTANYKTSMPDGPAVVHSVYCVATKPCEQWLNHRLANYRYKSEWFQCDLIIIKKAVNDAVSFVNSQLTEDDSNLLTTIAPHRNLPLVSFTEQTTFLSFLNDSSNILYEAGSETSLKDLTSAYSSYLKRPVHIIDRQVLTQANSQFIVYSCRSCNFCQSVQGKGCCPTYQDAERTLTYYVRNLRLVPSSSSSLHQWLRTNLIKDPGKRIHLHRFDKAYGSRIGKALIERLLILGCEVGAVSDKQRDTGCCSSAFRCVRNISIRNWSDSQQKLIHWEPADL